LIGEFYPTQESNHCFAVFVLDSSIPIGQQTNFEKAFVDCHAGQSTMMAMFSRR